MGSPPLLGWADSVRAAASRDAGTEALSFCVCTGSGVASGASAGDREAPATLLVGDVADPILGVETLEVLGLKVDPGREKVIPSRGYAARLGGWR